MEQYLRGKNGVKTLSVGKDGSIEESYAVAPEQGGTVITTINKDIQEIAQSSLEERIKSVTDDEEKILHDTPSAR